MQRIDATRAQADLGAKEVLIRSRPISVNYRCLHCGRAHRLDPTKLGRVVAAACGRGPVAVELVVPGAADRLRKVVHR